jgi:hypothetical protein
MSRISLVIPIDLFSFFVYANLQNVFETCGAPNDIDFVFLTANTVKPEITSAFEDAAKQYKFRVITTPFQPGPNHLRLLDWSIRHADLSDWIIIQHCDLFWREPGWLQVILREINDALTLLCVPCPSRYFLRQMSDSPAMNINITGDFFGVYNRQSLINRKLYFECGTLGTEVPVSNEVADHIRRGLICRNGVDPIIFGKEYMDGSQAMAWELYVHDPESIKQIDIKGLLHLTGFFRIAECVKRKGKHLFCNFPLDMNNYAYYSYLTSFCIDRMELGDVALPWSCFVKIAERKYFDYRPNWQTGIWLRSYSQSRHIVGMSQLGISRVSLLGREFSTSEIKHF